MKEKKVHPLSHYSEVLQVLRKDYYAFSDAEAI